LHRRLARKEKLLLEKKCAGKLENYNVMKNVSTHSIINASEGKSTEYCEIEIVNN
jgi:hypothetical protein